MSASACSLAVAPDAFPDPAYDASLDHVSGRAVAVLAGGCFWCTEAVYRELEGVLEVVSGYAGGDRNTASYELVCSGGTNHAEAIQVTYDPSRISYGGLLKVFFSVAHDPTQLNRQGNDIGRQYRSAIFYAHPQQKRIADHYIKQLDAAGVFIHPVVTRIEKLDEFFEAERYHQDYARLNPAQPYIACVAIPKVEKLRRYFRALSKQ